MEKSLLLKQAQAIAQEFIEFVNKAVSPYHVTDQCRQILLKSGYSELSETENWQIKAGGRYFFTRNDSTIFAFSVGNKYQANNTGFKVIGCHTDSPCIRLAPVSKLKNQQFNQACVQLYGGGLWHTWLDRDLTIAGKIIHLNPDTNTFETKLMHYQKPLLKIPNLAIHLQTEEERTKFGPNKETHFRPIFSTEIYDKLLKGNNNIEDTQTGGLYKKHYRGLVDLIQRETQVNVDNIVDCDFVFTDSNPSQLIGLNEEFISSPRLDNLLSSFCALKGIIDPEVKLDDQSYINIVCLFDHEECGSESAQGAMSPLLLQNLGRIYKILNLAESEKVIEDSFEKAIQKSFFISADMAHAIHPNQSEKHQINHQVKINQGIVIKQNSNQRYATDAVSKSLIQIIAKKGDVPIQDFIVKNDSPCGSTIGPIVAAQTGIKTVDIGAPQLGMHSIRETGGVLDTFYYLQLFKTFYQEYEKIQHTLLNH